LLDRYRNALLDAGAAAPARDELFLRYRRTPAYGYGVWLQTWIFGDYQDAAISEACMSRFGAAFDDLETEKALKAG